MTPDNHSCCSSLPRDHYSEFRFDPLTERWTLIAEGRGARPSCVKTASPLPRIEASNAAIVSSFDDDGYDCKCAFCPGNESVTTESVGIITEKNPLGDQKSVDDYVSLSLTSDGELSRRRWFARAIENKFPIFRDREHVSTLEFDVVQHEFQELCRPRASRFFCSLEASGRHEVVVDVRRHIRGWGEMTSLEINLAFRLLQSRLRALRESGRYEYGFFFKNVGVNAGASQPHSHCQLTGNVSLPEETFLQLSRVAQYERRRFELGETESFFDTLVNSELEANERVVTADSDFILYCPYASRFPMQVEICPRFDGSFEDYGARELASLAELSRQTIVALQCAHERRFPDDPTPVDYNVVMTNTPYRVVEELSDACRVFRPRITVLPSLVKKAGYEYASGIDVNPISPETAARLYANQFE